MPVKNVFPPDSICGQPVGVKTKYRDESELNSQSATTTERPPPREEPTSKIRLGYMLGLLSALIAVSPAAAAAHSETATMDRAFLESGSFILRNNTDYRYLTANGIRAADSP